MALVISIPREKAVLLGSLILAIIEARAISHATIESFIGRLAFVQPTIFGCFARAMLKPLYDKLYTAHLFSELSPPYP